MAIRKREILESRSSVTSSCITSSPAQVPTVRCTSYSPRSTLSLVSSARPRKLSPRLRRVASSPFRKASVPIATTGIRDSAPKVSSSLRRMGMCPSWVPGAQLVARLTGSPAVDLEHAHAGVDCRGVHVADGVGHGGNELDHGGAGADGLGQRRDLAPEQLRQHRLLDL